MPASTQEMPDPCAAGIVAASMARGCQDQTKKDVFFVPRQHASHEERLPSACDGELSAASTGVPGGARAARFVN